MLWVMAMQAVVSSVTWPPTPPAHSQPPSPGWTKAPRTGNDDGSEVHLVELWDGVLVLAVVCLLCACLFTCCGDWARTSFRRLFSQEDDIQPAHLHPHPRPSMAGGGAQGQPQQPAPAPAVVEIEAVVSPEAPGSWLAEEGYPSESQEAAMCAICLEPLWRGRAGVLMKDGGRVCRHLLHYRCVASATAKRSKICPLCRAEGDEVVRVPRPHENPERWFELMDVNREGALTKVEVLDGLRAQLDVDEDGLSDLVSDAWAKRDVEGAGVLSVADLPPLLASVRDARLPPKQKPTPSSPALPKVPPLPNAVLSTTSGDSPRPRAASPSSSPTGLSTSPGMEWEQAGPEGGRQHWYNNRTHEARWRSPEVHEPTECSICLQPLCRQPVGVLVRRGGARRACGHSFHMDCLETAFAACGGRCPECGLSGVEMRRVPDPESSPWEWFLLMDVDGTERLTRGEVMSALCMHVDLPTSMVGEAVAEGWGRWDASDTGSIELDELPALVQYIRETGTRGSEASEAP
eukprot:Hpha_TRINITY_DN15776_c2_g1::TRINITY_DN15776_c2_g1_i3::g.38733::m.38733